jgi:hypothetical protein
LAANTEISNAELRVQYLGPLRETASQLDFSADLYGLGPRANATISIEDYHDGVATENSGVLIEPAVLSKHTRSGSIAVSNRKLLQLVRGLFDAEGKPKAAFAAFRISPDVELPVNSVPLRGFILASADAPSAEYRPTLTLKVTKMQRVDEELNPVDGAAIETQEK